MTRFILGVDMAKATFDIHILDHHKPKASLHFKNDLKGFEQMLKKLPEGQYVLGVESTSTYHLELVEWAHEQGWEVFVLNPSRVKANNQTMSPTHKTDSIDAWLIAEFVRQKQHLLRPWVPQDPVWKEARDTSRRREVLVRQRTREFNRLEALTKHQRSLKASINRSIKFYDREIARLESVLKKLLKRSGGLGGQVGLLKTIPGVGDVLAMTLSCEFGPLQEHESAKDLTARSGLVPMERTSGSSVRGKSRITKAGNSRVRRVLYMAAMGAMRSNEWQGWLEERRANNKDGKRLLMAVMDKLLRVCFGVIKSGLPFDEKTAFGS